MHDYPIIRDIVIILLVSIPIVFIFNKVKIPSIVGFLIAGILIGPHGYGLISETEQIEVMAEIGVIMLLFTIGLEISIQKLIRMRRLLIVAGGLQVSLTILITSVLFYFFGIPLNQSVFFGMLVSVSSTAIVLKLLADKNELEAPHGRIALGILILQDLAIVPMILFTPILASAGELALGDIVLQLLLSFLAITAIVLLSRFLIPRIIYLLATTRVREAFTIGTLLLILGTAYLTETAGLSLALGAFVAGLMISESEFSHQVFADIIPLKDAFNSIFFVSIGMLLNTYVLLAFPLHVGALIIGIIILKSAIITSIVLLMRFPTRTALITGISLAQVGEFSFVLASVGVAQNLIQAEYYNAFLASSIFTMLLTPFLVRAAPHLAARVSGLHKCKVEASPEVEAQKPERHVIVVGYGLNGQYVTRVLKETGIKYIIVELNPETVRRLARKNEPVIFGDVTKVDIFESAHVRTAQVVVFAISDPAATIRGIKVARSLNPKVFTIVRCRDVSEIEEIRKHGADVVIPEGFETSLQIFSKVLEKYHIPLNVIVKQMAILRDESYQMMVKEDVGMGALTHIDKILAAGVTETYFVEKGNPNIGKTLSELNLRARTGATIIAVVRDGTTLPSPSPDERIEANDTHVLVGNHRSVDEAIRLLNGEGDRGQTTSLVT